MSLLRLTGQYHHMQCSSFPPITGTIFSHQYPFTQVKLFVDLSLVRNLHVPIPIAFLFHSHCTCEPDNCPSNGIQTLPPSSFSSANASKGSQDCMSPASKVPANHPLRDCQSSNNSRGVPARYRFLSQVCDSSF